MRFVVFVLGLAVILLPLTAWASGFNFGGFSCSQRLPCNPDDPVFSSSAAVANSTNDCVTQNTAYAMPSGGYFDGDAGLDSNGCLSSIPGAFSKASGTPVALQCCLKPIPAGGCTIQCDAINQ